MDDTILVIDDTYDSRYLLSNILLKAGFHVSTASDGEQGVSLALADPPNLILLDIMMPDLDGFEVCTALKADSRTREIPVIFISALHETFDKVKAFELGGVDYITKPFEQQEVLARVRTHLTLQHQQDLLAAQNGTLQDLLAEKQEIFDVVSHDLKNPLQAIIGYNDLITMNPDKSKAYTQEIQKACQRMLHLITNLEHSNLLESGRMCLSLETLDLRRSLTDILAQFQQRADARQIRVLPEFPSYPVYVRADPHALLEILDNLISNALKYSPDKTEVHLIVSKEGQNVRCAVHDQGQGFTEEDALKMFKKFSRLSATPQGGERATGLGLSIVKALVEAMHGRVWAESPGKDQGSTFYIEFPEVLDDDE